MQPKHTYDFIGNHSMCNRREDPSYKELMETLSPLKASSCHPRRSLYRKVKKKRKVGVAAANVPNLVNICFLEMSGNGSNSTVCNMEKLIAVWKRSRARIQAPERAAFKRKLKQNYQRKIDKLSALTGIELLYILRGTINTRGN